MVAARSKAVVTALDGVLVNAGPVYPRSATHAEGTERLALFEVRYLQG
jgi:hypothetical protein